MAIKALHLAQGLIIGETSELLTGGYKVSYPLLLTPSQDGLAFSEFLAIFEENEIFIEPNQLVFGTLFTPLKELAQGYINHLGFNNDISKE